MESPGFLAIWSDLAPEDETDWAHWITREHAAERVGVDGFVGCRIFRALGTGANRYFILYELEEPEVVASPQYLSRLNAPTPWSQKIMPRLQNFRRGGGRVIASAGLGQAGVIAVVSLENEPQWDAAAVTAELARLDGISGARVLLTDLDRTSIRTHEKSMRTKDDSFAGLLLVEGLDEAAIRRALWHLRAVSGLPPDLVQDVPLYRLFFSLSK
ncbi:MAG TPA: hypothetical protein VGL45_13785 [Bradyrhizobium sp.]|jgi:hypothetical protein